MTLQARLTIQSVGFFLALALFYFVPAGTLRSWQAWNFLVLFAIACVAMNVWFMKRDPKLIERRLSMGEKGEKRPLQKLVQFTLGPAFVLTFVLAGLDHRFGWTRVPDAIAIIANALVGIGLLVFFVVFRENSFASATVEIDAEQKVVTSGPYALVRHPMYTGGLLFLFAMPLALGSFVAQIFFPLFLVLIVLRMQDEERLLAEKLPGYSDYMRATPYRLLPGIY